jgi:hypothetical protein
MGVVSAEHVRQGVEWGVAQVNHGARAPLARMSAGDWFVYYSPREGMKAGPVLRSFTAIGRLADDEVYQAEQGEFRPYRRRVAFEPHAVVTPIAGLPLELTARPNWGYALRLGLVPLSDHDLDVVRGAMLGG